jgi:vacuolar-type H+-ATPase subunit H
MASLNALSADRQHERADVVVAMARRHADEIRTAAEHEADRILREAERQAAFLAGERLDAHQHEVERMAGLRKDIQSCLEAAVSALERAREVSAVEANPSVYPPASDSPMSAAVPAPSLTDPVDQASPDRRRHLYWIAVVIWGMFMLSIVLLVSMPPADRGALASTPVLDDLQQNQTADDQAVHAAPVSAVSASQRQISHHAHREPGGWLSTQPAGRQEQLLNPSGRSSQARDTVTLKLAARGVCPSDQRPAGAMASRQVVAANHPRELPDATPVVC